MCKDLQKLLHDVYTSMVAEWNYEIIGYKPKVNTPEMPRIRHHFKYVSIVTCMMGNGHVFTNGVSGVSCVLIDVRRVLRTHALGFR
jgi:hypothetical protein